ncbi:PIN domain-like protein [Amylocystis lapponica]|nr:PIN domain-like protein [Amylocystis lapponica]
MGIHGLTTYLREHKSSLARHVHFTSQAGIDPGSEVPKRVPVVVDGWSFIYELSAASDLPWAYGGEYPVLAALIRRVVQAWIDVGLSLHFVFDGPFPSLKFRTLIERTTKNNIQHSLLFFRTSAPARAAPRFLKETGILPLLIYSVTVKVLTEIAHHSPDSSTIPGSTRGVEHTDGADGKPIPDHALAVHFADEEGDPYAVALAGRLGAYVAGRDSDFVVLNAEGYSGYIPLDEMLWNVLDTPSPDASMSATGSVYSESAVGDVDTDEDADGFRTVRSTKSRKRTAVDRRSRHGPVPPDISEVGSGTLSLSLAVYSPATLADHLELSVSLLPLLGALVGNDFTKILDDSPGGKRDLQRLFFESRLTSVQRITRAAGAIRGILDATFHAPAVKRRGKQVGSVIELIDAAVTALLLRADGLTEGERETVVERIVKATLQYALPRYERSSEGETERGAEWESDVCILHAPETCPLYLCLSRGGLANGPPFASNADSSVSDIDLEWEPLDAGESPDHRALISALYIAAYRRGALSPRTLDPMKTITSWPRLFLEDPDKESVARSVGRPLRLWGYALLDVGVQARAEDDKEGVHEDDEDEDELVDVVEEDDEDLLAPLRGALQQLDGSENDISRSLGSPNSSAVRSAKSPPSKIVVEYVRRGTRLAPEEVSIPPLSDVLAFAVDIAVDTSLPVQLWPADARFTLLLRLLRADVTGIRALSGEHLTSVLVVRWIVQIMHTRAVESAGNKEREKERWTQAEARAFLTAFSSLPDAPEITEPVSVVERNVQLVAQVLVALDALEQLAQILLLAMEVPSPAHRFSGRRMHLYLTNPHALAAATTLEDGVWGACIEGLEHAFAEQKGTKKERRKKSGTAVPAKVPGKVPPKGGLYSLLANMDA